jgi:flagellar biosynthesis protein FlhF
MRVKSYFAATVEAAIAQASKELGDEAMLVYSRPASPEAKYLGRYEVVFALPEEPAAPESKPTPVPVSESPSADRLEKLIAQVYQETRELAFRLEQMSVSISRQRSPAIDYPRVSRLGGSALETLAARLEATGFPHVLAHQLVVEAGVAASEAPGTAPQACLRSLLTSRLKVDPVLGRPCADGGPRMVAFVGPPGSGKTTSLVKLAARYGVGKQPPCHILSLDSYRIAAADQLSTFAGILGISFDVADTPGALRQAATRQGRQIIFIDTPGIGPRDNSAASDLQMLLQAVPEIDVHLTLPATTKAADLCNVMDRFARFHPRHILLTRLDETGSLGHVVAESVARGIPFSFLANGQQIPEDIEEASQTALLLLLLGADEPEPLFPKASGNVAAA